MMSAAQIFNVLILFIVAEFALTKYIGYLNTKNWSNVIPKELKGIYDEQKYKKSQKYEKEKYVFGFIASTFSFLLLLVALFLGFFG
jgi:STE24 endopeptidase